MSRVEEKLFAYRTKKGVLKVASEMYELVGSDPFRRKKEVLVESSVPASAKIITSFFVELLEDANDNTVGRKNNKVDKRFFNVFINNYEYDNVFVRWDDTDTDPGNIIRLDNKEPTIAIISIDMRKKSRIRVFVDDINSDSVFEYQYD